MRVLMLGWEFPPVVSGGLGTACEGLARALAHAGTQVLFVMPRSAARATAPGVELVGLDRHDDPQPAKAPDHLSPIPVPANEPRPDRGQPAPATIEFLPVDANLNPYRRPEPTILHPATGWHEWVPRPFGSAPPPPPEPPLVNGQEVYQGDLFAEVDQFALRTTQAVAGRSFDLIHAHDWMTFPAAERLAGLTGVPWVAHVHSTEFDRSVRRIDQRIYDIERRGLHVADAVIAVSHLTAGILARRYGLSSTRVTVVYNAVTERSGVVDSSGGSSSGGSSSGGNGHPVRDIGRDEKVVLYLGRITLQKGPEYFLAAARKVLQVERNVRFVMAGHGDLAEAAMRLSQDMGIADRVTFTGFLRGSDVERMFRCADLFVMPSVSDPFGIATLEAVSYDVPVLVSRQSGVTEVLRHVLTVDFWDTDDMANKIVAVLRHPPLSSTLKSRAGFELKRLCWDDSAQSVMRVYETLLTETTTSETAPSAAPGADA